MRLSLSGLLTACVVLAAAGAVAKVLALLIVLGCIAALISRPRETIALVATLGALNLFALFPLPAFGLVGVFLARRFLSQKRRRPRSRFPNSPAKPGRIKQLPKKEPHRGDKPNRDG